MLSAKAVAMSALKDNAAAANGSGRGVGKSRRSRRHGNARTAFQSLVAATPPYHNWPDFVYEVSSSSSEQDNSKVRSFGRTSNNEDFRLACPYSKLKSLEVIQSMQEAADLDRSRCWSKSYRNISRLKYAEMLPQLTLNMIANETFQISIGNTCIAFIAGQNSYADGASRSFLVRNCSTLTAIECQYVIQAKRCVPKG
jgi:hypothetical protein